MSLLIWEAALKRRSNWTRLAPAAVGGFSDDHITL